MRPGRFAAQPLGMVAGGDQQDGGDIRADAVDAQQAGGLQCDQRREDVVEAVDLLGEILRSAAQLAQARPGWRSQRSRRAGSQRGQLGDQGVGGVPAKRARRSSGPVRTRARIWLIARVRSPRAERLATINARMASTVPSRPLGAPLALPDWAARAALTASRGSDLPGRRRSCRSGPVDLDHS